VSTDKEKNNQRIRNLEARLDVLESRCPRFFPDVQSILLQRGFSCYSSCPIEKLILPVPKTEENMNFYFKHLRKYSFRLFLRDVILHKERFTLNNLQNFCSLRTAERYLKILLILGMVVQDEKGLFSLKNRAADSFGETLEWFASEIFIREFRAPAKWGLKIPHLNSGGDYDVIALLDHLVVMVETKSSPPKHIHQPLISEFFERIHDLMPDISIFLDDTQLRLEDKINVMFQEELHRRNIEYKLKKILRGVYTINNTIFVINGKPDLIGNIRTCLRSFFAARAQKLF